MTETVEPWLTRDEGKLAYYRDDPYFWEGWASYVACRPVGDVLRRLTFLLVKPETIVGRRVEPILEFLRSGGYRIIGTWPVRMGRHEARGVWRYTLNTVPIAHIRALEMLVTAGELFLVGIDHELASGEASAADLLSRSKGSSAHPDVRGTLRERLGRPAFMLNFVHAPDEPADVLRELAVLCDAAQQEQIITAMLAAGQWSPAQFEAAAREAASIMTSRYACSPAHDLDIAATLRRMRARLRDGNLQPEARAAIELGETSPDRALEVVRSLADATELPHWDRIVTAAHLVDGLRTGRSPMIRLGPAHEREQRDGFQPEPQLRRRVAASALEDRELPADGLLHGGPQHQGERAVDVRGDLLVYSACPQVKAGTVVKADRRCGQAASQPYFRDADQVARQRHELTELFRVITRAAVSGRCPTAQFHRLARSPGGIGRGDIHVCAARLAPAVPEREPGFFARNIRHEFVDALVGA